MMENPEFTKFVRVSPIRHIQADWGNVDRYDKQANDQNLKKGNRLLSAYHDERFPGCELSTIWIITEAGRSAIPILFPDEY
jgi:hypothetical protein